MARLGPAMMRWLWHQRQRNFMRLWTAQLISQFGDRIHQLALVGLMAERAPGSSARLAGLMAFTIIPVFVVQPWAGVLVDRWDRRATLFYCDLARGLLVLWIPLLFMRGASLVPIYTVVFLVFCFSRFYVPAKMSIVPDLVGQEDLLQANALVTTTGMIASVLGFGVGAVLIEYVGARQGFLMDAGTFMLSAMLLWGMRPGPRAQAKARVRARTGGSSVWRDMREGFIYLVAHREIRFVIQTLAILLAAAGAVYIVLVVFIQQTFASVTKDIGILTPFLGAGLFVGSLAYGKWGHRWQVTTVSYACLSLGGLLLILFTRLTAWSGSIMVAAALALILGLVIGPVFVAANTMTHRICHEHMRGKVFSALEIVIHAAFLAAMLLSSWLAEWLSPAVILTGVGAGLGMIGLLGLFFWRGDPQARRH